MTRAPDPNSDILYAFLAAVAAAVVPLLALPFVEMGIADDFSYIKTAKDLAETGRFLYNGWATASIGAQAWVGAMAVHLFGFSFTAVRLTMLLFAAGCGALCYALLRRSRIGPPLALLGSLTLTVSPVFVPCAASFMTDISGLFFWLLGVYAAMRLFGDAGAADAEDAPRPSRLATPFWLLLIVVCGALGGTIRQICWLIPLTAIPLHAAHLHLRRPKIPLTHLAALLLFAGAVAYNVRWFKHQPYAVIDDIDPQFTFAELRWLIEGYVITFVPTLMMLLTPICIHLLPTIRKRLSRRYVVTAVGVAVAVGLFRLSLTSPSKLPSSLPRFFEWPFWGDIFFITGPWGRFFEIGYRFPRTHTLLPAALITFYFLLSFLFVGAGYRYTKNLLRARDIDEAGGLLDRGRLKDALMRAPFGTFAVTLVVAYFFLLLVRYVFVPGVIVDRYLLPVCPLLLMAILRRQQRSDLGRVIRRPTWIALTLFAAYAVASTQTLYAANKARLEVANRLMKAGVPATRFAVGLDYDGWTELSISRSLNEKRVRYPKDFYDPSVPPWGLPSHDEFISKRVPNVRPLYFVVVERQREFVDATEFAPLPFTTWLPPFRGTIYVQKRAAAASAVPAQERPR